MTEKFIKVEKLENTMKLFGNFDENIKIIEKEYILILYLLNIWIKNLMMDFQGVVISFLSIQIMN